MIHTKMCFQGIWQQNEPDYDPELKRVNFRPLNGVIGKKKFDLIKCKTQLKNEIRINPTFDIRKTVPDKDRRRQKFLTLPLFSKISF